MTRTKTENSLRALISQLSGVKIDLIFKSLERQERKRGTTSITAPLFIKPPPALAVAAASGLRSLPVDVSPQRSSDLQCVSVQADPLNMS